MDPNATLRIAALPGSSSSPAKGAGRANPATSSAASYRRPRAPILSNIGSERATSPNNAQAHASSSTRPTSPAYDAPQSRSSVYSSSSSDSHASRSRRRLSRETLFSLPLDNPEAWRGGQGRNAPAEHRWSTWTADTLHSVDDGDEVAVAVENDGCDGVERLRVEARSWPASLQAGTSHAATPDPDDRVPSPTAPRDSLDRSPSDAALDAVLDSTMAALEAANALLVETMATRTQLASLRAMQCALDDSLTLRERELREQIEANRVAAEWKRGACREMEAALFGVALGGARSAPTLEPVPEQRSAPSPSRKVSWNGASGFISVRASSAAVTAAQVGLGDSAPHLAARDDDATIGKSAAKRLEKVLRRSSSMAPTKPSHADTAANTTMTGSETDMSGEASISSSYTGDESSSSVDSRASSPARLVDGLPGGARDGLGAARDGLGFGATRDGFPFGLGLTSDSIASHAPKPRTQLSMPSLGNRPATTTKSLFVTPPNPAIPLPGDASQPPSATSTSSRLSHRRSGTVIRSPPLATSRRGHAAQSSITSSETGGLWSAEERRRDVKDDSAGQGALAALKRLNEQTASGADRPARRPSLSSTSPRLGGGAVSDEVGAPATTSTWSSLASWVPVGIPRLGRGTSAGGEGIRAGEALGGPV